MKKMISIFIMVLVSLTAQAYTVTEIREAFIKDQPLVTTPAGSFDEALNLIASSNRSKIVAGRNILALLLKTGNLSENKHKAVMAAIKLADDNMSLLNQSKLLIGE